MHSDQRQPGWNVYRPIWPPPRFTSSTFVLSGVRVSSGAEKSRVSTPGIVIPSGLSDLLPGVTPVPIRCMGVRSEEHTSELQSQSNLVCRLLLEKKKKN